MEITEKKWFAQHTIKIIALPDGSSRILETVQENMESTVTVDMVVPYAKGDLFIHDGQFDSSVYRVVERIEGTERSESAVSLKGKYGVSLDELFDSLNK